MKNMTLHNIAEACHGTIYNYKEEKDREIEGVTLNSIQVGQDYLFIATKGERVDGHSYIPQAEQKGAVCIVCEKLPESLTGGTADSNAVYILVQDSFQALKSIAEFYRRQLKISVVGITGSVGKTSTKELIAAVLSVRYKVLKTEGNYNNEVGLPLTILKIRDYHETAVVEMGISDFGEMHRLSRIAKPDICILTNIGQCHLERLGSREGVLRAKTEIFDYMQEDGAVCINGDDDMLAAIEQVKGKKPLRFGKGKGNRIYAENIVNKGLFGSSADIHIDDMEFHADIPLPGEHMIYNALAAACAGSLMGLTGREIAEGISRVRPVEGRSRIMRLKDRLIIDDCYNANPVSMCAALDLLAAAPARKAAIMGDMLELGDGEREMHEEVGAYAAAMGIDVILCIGRLAENIYEGALKKARETGISTEYIYYFPQKKDFFDKKEILREGDTILVKASHGMGFDEIIKALEE